MQMNILHILNSSSVLILMYVQYEQQTYKLDVIFLIFIINLNFLLMLNSGSTVK